MAPRELSSYIFSLKTANRGSGCGRDPDRQAAAVIDQSYQQFGARTNSLNRNHNGGLVSRTQVVPRQTDLGLRLEVDVPLQTDGPNTETHGATVA